MKTFFFFFKSELKRLLCKRNLAIYFLLLLFTMGFLQNGIFEFNNVQTKKEKFQEVEDRKIQLYFNYRVYGLLGFRLFFLPHPMSVFFNNSTPISDMTAFIDSGERLRIYNSLQGAGIFKTRQNSLTDFSGSLIFLAGLISVLFGLEAAAYREYLRILATYAGKKTVLPYILLSRAVLLVILFVSIIGAGVLLAAVNGVYIPLDKHLPVFTMQVCLTALFFLVLGSVFGSCKNKVAGFIYALVCWSIFVFVIPTAIATATAARANLITPVYEYEIEKLKIVTDFEI
ncbi:MAG: hypothetical protein GY950_14690, partial [bacterium]|nr:hypothetical protein [bacterium]